MLLSNCRFIPVRFVLAAAVLVGVFHSRLCAQTADAKKLTITIEAAKTAEPVSPYIYGQFIEHLGRCIYGGIWAEMLEDRKFFYPVPADSNIWGDRNDAKVLIASPWRVIGPKDAVSMSRDNPWVGEHSPQIRLSANGTPTGIFHDGLALLEGKDYIGRIVIAGTASAAPVEVSLVWGEGKDDRSTVTVRKVRTRFNNVPLTFKAKKATDNGRLEIVGRGQGSFKIGAVSLMPADNIKGMRADTVKLLKELNSPIYRWPGGNFVSGYDWRDGIGEPDKRPPRKNPAWTGIEHNDFGLDEFIIFCREIGAEPVIIVNSGFGDDHSAAEEVEYANGSPDTPMGKWRAANGRPKPYNVTWWGIGNEMYGKWQLGYMSLDQYAIKHNLFAKAMRKIDPSIKIIAVGDTGAWSRGMLQNCADYMDLISEHFYRKGKKSVPEHVFQTVDAIRSRVDAHTKYRQVIESIKGKNIRIALDEWNYWYGPYVYGELGTRYFLKDALGIAAGLNEMVRNSNMIFMANYAQTVNVIGCIKTTQTDAALETTALPLMLYRRNFGSVPVAITGTAEPLDLVAAWTSDRKALTVAIVNPTEDNYHIGLEIKDARLSAAGAQLWKITGPDPMAHNEPGKPPKVVIEQTKLSPGAIETLAAPPLSVCLYRLPVR